MHMDMFKINISVNLKVEIFEIPHLLSQKNLMWQIHLLVRNFVATHLVDTASRGCLSRHNLSTQVSLPRFL